MFNYLIYSDIKQEIDRIKQLKSEERTDCFLNLIRLNSTNYNEELFNALVSDSVLLTNILDNVKAFYCVNPPDDVSKFIDKYKLEELLNFRSQIFYNQNNVNELFFENNFPIVYKRFYQNDYINEGYKLNPLQKASLDALLISDEFFIPFANEFKVLSSLGLTHKFFNNEMLSEVLTKVYLHFENDYDFFSAVVTGGLKLHHFHQNLIEDLIAHHPESALKIFEVGGKHIINKGEAKLNRAKRCNALKSNLQILETNPGALKSRHFHKGVKNLISLVNNNPDLLTPYNLILIDKIFSQNNLKSFNIKKLVTFPKLAKVIAQAQEFYGTSVHDFSGFIEFINIARARYDLEALIKIKGYSAANITKIVNEKRDSPILRKTVANIYHQYSLTERTYFVNQLIKSEIAISTRTSRDVESSIFKTVATMFEFRDFLFNDIIKNDSELSLNGLKFDDFDWRDDILSVIQEKMAAKQSLSPLTIEQINVPLISERKFLYKVLFESSRSEIENFIKESKELISIHYNNLALVDVPWLLGNMEVMLKVPESAPHILEMINKFRAKTGIEPKIPNFLQDCKLENEINQEIVD